MLQGKTSQYKTCKQLSLIFLIPILRFQLRNCKQIIKYVLGNNSQLAFDHDGDSGTIVQEACTSFLDIDVPDNLLKGLDPTDVGVGLTREIEKAMRLVEERQGKRGVAVLFNYWSRSLGTRKHYKILKSIKEGIMKAGREEPLLYSCEIGLSEENLRGATEEHVSEWMRAR